MLDVNVTNLFFYPHLLLCTFHPLHHINIPSPCPLLSFLLFVYFVSCVVCLPQNDGKMAIDVAKTEVRSDTLVPLDMSPLRQLVLTFFILALHWRQFVCLSVYMIATGH